MHLGRVRLAGVPALPDLSLSFADESGVPRSLVLLFGADGTGKTTLLNAIAHTRPGHTLPPLPQRRARPPSHEKPEPVFVVAEWVLGRDDPDRPHPLVVASPSAVIAGEDEAQAIARRREQAMFDKRAQERGFALLAISGARWFSRTSVMLSSPERTVAKYDPRAAASFDDATRADLARETKQVLSYAAIAHALEVRAESLHITPLAVALREALRVALAPFDARWEGADAATLEPVFAHGPSELVLFDDLPKGARHLVAIVSLATRALYGAYEGDASPVREREGVVLVDDLESQQDAATLRELPMLLRRALPGVQWVLTTAHPSATMGCSRDQVLALRRTEIGLEVHAGDLAVLH